MKKERRFWAGLLAVIVNFSSNGIARAENRQYN